MSIHSEEWVYFIPIVFIADNIIWLVKMSLSDWLKGRE
jgi:hypothetical protein